MRTLPAPLTTPSGSLAAALILGFGLVGVGRGSISDLGFIGGQAGVAVWLVAGLSRSAPEESSRLRTMGSVSLLLGLAALIGFAMLPAAYDSGPGRTGLIDGAAFWVAAIIHLGSLLVVLYGVTGASPHVDQDTITRARQYLLVGTWIGACIFVVLQLAVAYDLT